MTKLAQSLRRRAGRVKREAKRGALSLGFNRVERIIAKTMAYLSVPCVVGHERVFLRYLRKDFHALGFVTTDHEGLMAVHGKRPHSAIVCVHVDRHGLISLGEGVYEYAAQLVKEMKYGEPNPASQIEMQNIARRFIGEHMLAYDADSGVILDQGTIAAHETAEASGNALFTVPEIKVPLPPGIPVAYARTARVETEYFKGQLDNAISLAVMHALFTRGFEGTCLFTTEEEIGKSWVHIARYLDERKIETQNLIVLDTSPYVDTEPVKEGYVIFRQRDRSAIFNPYMARAFAARAKTLGFPCHYKDAYLTAMGKKPDELGSTELGKLVLHSGGRWSGGSVQIPTLLYHTSNETTSKLAIKNYYRFLKSILIEEPMEFGTEQT